MINTLNKHVKWRRDRENILICDCKRMVDLKLPIRFLDFIEKIWKGVDKQSLNNVENKIFSDFEKMKLLSNLEIRKIKEKEFSPAMNILDNELGKERVRNKAFLYKKFKEFPNLFLGIFLDNELAGLVCGFPRQDYLLMSELAVDFRFQKRGFGKKLVKAFEETTKKLKYKKINVGADDSAIKFYKSLNYKPFLLIQYKKGESLSKDFKESKEFKITKESEDNAYTLLETNINKNEYTLENLKKLRKKYPKAFFQYIFTKQL